MTFKMWSSTEGRNQLRNISWILGLSLLMCFMVIAGSIACREADREEVAQEEDASTIKEGISKFEGNVKAGVGRYLFIPNVRGLDIIVQGQIESGDASVLVGKEVRGEGEFHPERPSVLIANTIEIKEERGWRNVFSRTEEFALEDYLDLKSREEFQLAETLSAERSQDWEGKERVRVFGKLEKKTVTEGGEQKEIYNIVVSDEKGREIGRIIVDSFSDYALYYMDKLRFFDSFVFYITVKDTVEWRVRRRTRELFHADVLFAGLF